MDRHGVPVLAFRLHANARDSQVIDPRVALARSQRVRESLTTALANPRSKSGQTLRDTGFISLILMDALGQVVHIERFQDGLCGAVMDDGVTAFITDARPEDNVGLALAWLARLDQYCAWCVRVDLAKTLKARPPVLELPVCDALKTWVGRAAHTYFEAWKTQVFADSAGKHQAAVHA